MRDEVVAEHDDILPIFRMFLLNYFGQSFVKIGATELIIATFDNLNGNGTSETDRKIK